MREANVKRVLANLAVVIASIAFALFLSEVVVRTVLDPVDYLNPTLVVDKYLNHRIEGYSGGHDEWGFRNYRKPASAEIVCIGDSMTYGVSALASESWPAVLAQIQHKTVYNLALGGYGPIQYLHLIGFSLGTEFFDVYNIVRSNSNWKQYDVWAAGQFDGPAFVFPDRKGKFLGGLRDWLSKHSVVYAMVTRLPIFEFVRTNETKGERDKGRWLASVLSRCEARHRV
jgi:hypothetical protein